MIDIVFLGTPDFAVPSLKALVENGYNVKCTISGGDVELMSVSLYVADSEQAKIIKKNFYKNPQLFYQVMLATMTRNTSFIKDTLDDLAAIG